MPRSADLDNGILLTESLTPNMRMEFDHVVSGRILLLPMRGAGPGSITMSKSPGFTALLH